MLHTESDAGEVTRFFHHLSHKFRGGLIAALSYTDVEEKENTKINCIGKHFSKILI